LVDFFGYGKWISGCGRTFLFSKKNVKYIILIALIIATLNCLKLFYLYFELLAKNCYLFTYKFKASWEKSLQACYEIGTNLLAVEYDEKDFCIASLAQSKLICNEDI